MRRCVRLPAASSRAPKGRLGVALSRWGARYARCFPALVRASWLALRGGLSLAVVPAAAAPLRVAASAGRSARSPGR